MNPKEKMSTGHTVSSENMETRIAFAELQNMLKSHIKTNTHGIEFLQSFILYSIGIVLCPTTQRYVSSAYVPLVQTKESIKAINFAKLTRDHIMKCIIKYNEARKILKK